MHPVAATLARTSLMAQALDLLERVARDVWLTFVNNWPFLLIGILASAAISVYVGTDRLSGWLRRRTIVAVVGAVALATFTPFC